MKACRCGKACAAKQPDPEARRRHRVLGDKLMSQQRCCNRHSRNVGGDGSAI